MQMRHESGLVRSLITYSRSLVNHTTSSSQERAKKGYEANAKEGAERQRK